MGDSGFLQLQHGIGCDHAFRNKISFLACILNESGVCDCAGLGSAVGYRHSSPGSERNLQDITVALWVFIIGATVLGGFVKGTVGFAMPTIMISLFGSVLPPET